MIQKNWKRAALMIVISVLLYELYKYLQLNRQCLRCEMSFMTPQYILMDRDKSTNYSLYQYVNDHSDNRLSVLYIPGNAASYAQVRSIGNLLKYPVYTVDFLEELSAFDPSVIFNQQVYIKKIIEEFLPENAKIVLIGHSMGGVIAKIVGCANERVEKIVLLAMPKSSVIPSILMKKAFTFPLCKDKAVDIIPALNDIHVPSDFDDNSIRVDSISMSWSDPNHQAIVWSNSIARYLSRIIHGHDGSIVASIMALNEQIDENYNVFEDCNNGTHGPFDVLLTSMKVNRDFVIKSSRNDINVQIIPGRYQKAFRGNVESCQHEYLTLIIGSQFYIERKCNDAKVNNDISTEYYLEASPFHQLLELEKKNDFLFIYNEPLITREKYLFGNSIYNLSKKDDCIIQITFPDSKTKIYPKDRFLSGPSGIYQVTIIPYKKGTFHASIGLNVIWTMFTQVQHYKESFQRGLLLGMYEKMPIIWILLSISFVFKSGKTALLFGFGLGCIFYELLMSKPKRHTPLYLLKHNQYGLQTMGAAMSFISIFLPFPLAFSTTIPVLAYSLLNEHKRDKALILLVLFIFELASSVGTVVNVGLKSGWKNDNQWTLMKLMPMMANFALAKHVRKLLFLPLATLFPCMPLIGCIISAVSAYLACDSEWNLSDKR